MPIGTIIGWLIGQLIVATLLVYNHRPIMHTSNAAVITWYVGLFLMFIAFFSLIGTFIELLV